MGVRATLLSLLAVVPAVAGCQRAPAAKSADVRPVTVLMVAPTEVTTTHSYTGAVRARVRLRKVSAHPSQRQYTVRVLVEMPGADLSAEESRADVISALDVVAGKIERRLRKRKTDRLAKRGRGVRRKS